MDINLINFIRPIINNAFNKILSYNYHTIYDNIILNDIIDNNLYLSFQHAITNTFNFKFNKLTIHEDESNNNLINIIKKSYLSFNNYNKYFANLKIFKYYYFNNLNVYHNIKILFFNINKPYIKYNILNFKNELENIIYLIIIYHSLILKKIKILSPIIISIIDSIIDLKCMNNFIYKIIINTIYYSLEDNLNENDLLNKKKQIYILKNIKFSNNDKLIIKLMYNININTIYEFINFIINNQNIYNSNISLDTNNNNKLLVLIENDIKYNLKIYKPLNYIINLFKKPNNNLKKIIQNYNILKIPTLKIPTLKLPLLNNLDLPTEPVLIYNNLDVPTEPVLIYNNNLDLPTKPVLIYNNLDLPTESVLIHNNNLDLPTESVLNKQVLNKSVLNKPVLINNNLDLLNKQVLINNKSYFEKVPIKCNSINSLINNKSYSVKVPIKCNPINPLLNKSYYVQVPIKNNKYLYNQYPLNQNQYNQYPLYQNNQYPLNLNHNNQYPLNQNNQYPLNNNYNLINNNNNNNKYIFY